MVIDLGYYVGSPRRVIRKMLKLAKPQYGELVVDIGSGEGNVVVEAALKYPDIRCLGYEINPDAVKHSRKRIFDKGLESRVEIIEGDVFDYNLGDADIVTTYLQSSGMIAIEDKIFTELGINARLVSHDYGFGKHRPNKWRPLLARSAFETWSPFPVPHSIKIYWMNDIKIRKPLKETMRDFFKNL